MSEQSDLDAAFAEVYRNCQANLVPKLEDYEIFAILKEHRQAQYWVAGATLKAGPVHILPNVRTGRAYQVIVEGVAGATEPFSTTSFPQVVYDGTAQLRDIGYDYSNVYDIRRATEKAIGVKLAKASEFTNSSDGDERAIFENLKKMATSWRTPIIM